MDVNQEKFLLPIPEKATEEPQLSLNLQAKRKCKEELKTIKGDMPQNFLGSLPLGPMLPRKPRTSSTSRELPKDRKERNKIFAKESRNRKNNYIKELEQKIDFLENKVMKLSMELDQYKHLLKVSDITKDKDSQLETVLRDFKETEAYFKEKLNECSNPENMCIEQWSRIMDSVGTNIGPIGTVRRKLLKTAFKLIIKCAMPQQVGYLCYITQFEEKASKREHTYMKKLSRQEILHYSKEKGFSPLDTMYALLRLDKKELEYMRRSSPIWQGLLIKTKEVIRNLLRCRNEMYEIALKLDDQAMDIYKLQRPETVASFYINFYRELSCSQVSIFDIYGLKRKKYIFNQDVENEVYALTDSDDE
ncbi:unnamed protein product [Moneuplotes crassus]|uniref:BZIP domain-containing protein n=2 Tax=Euplotes crassus TaxID=5936 RepID=A0AAD2D8U5_EUPCR|nr:unnamed protein product [Moneuplotes crassus]